ncbi:polyphosphate kinase 2 [Gammaproteobacteria bacterium]|nr:polyphosphate kinase 2 [Gammaproteobacteria bacterium]
MTDKVNNWRSDRLKSTRQIASIRETIHDIGEFDDFDNHAEEARSLLNKLKSKQKNAIIEAALSGHLQSEALKPYQAELIKLQVHLENTGQKAILLFDGRDAAGKGGTIRRVTRYMNEKHYRVLALGKPSDVQRTELHMKRYIEQFPHAGEMVLFDRSWYNRAMIEQVMGFCTRHQYRQFMERVNDYENSFVSDGKTHLLKLYFSVTKKEQARRFERRKNDPLRHWKLSEVDLQAQDMWDQLTEAKYKLLKKTHTEESPWFMIRSDDKHLARLETIKLILSQIKYRGRARTLDFSVNPDVVIRGDRELKIMEAQLAKKGAFKE